MEKNEVRNYPAFEDVVSSTTTIEYKLTENLNFIFFAFLIPMHPIVIEEKKRKCKKLKLPHLPYGKFQSLGCQPIDLKKGIILNNSLFKNCIQFFVGGDKGNPFIKIDKNCINICGARTTEESFRLFNHIITEINKYLDYATILANDKDLADYLLKITKDVNGGVKIYKKRLPETKDEWKKKYGELEDGVEEELENNKLVNWFLTLSEDFTDHNEIIQLVSYIIKHHNHPKLVLERKVQFAERLSYKIGFNVNPSIVRDLVEGKNGFYANYIGGILDKLNIQKRYDPPKEIKRKENKFYLHTFLLYHTGMVQQNGPNRELMRDVYYEFMDMIMGLRDLIEVVPEDDESEEDF